MFLTLYEFNRTNRNIFGEIVDCLAVKLTSNAPSLILQHL
jgi:hypothetical protein